MTVLLFYQNYSTFVKTDQEVLNEHYRVKSFEFGSHRKIKSLSLTLCRQMCFLLKYILKADVIYCWFADYHALLPVLFARLLGKKSLVIVGGYDAVALPEIGYGIFARRNSRYRIAKTVYRTATSIVAVDSSLIHSVNSYSTGRSFHSGVTAFVKRVENKCLSIPTGYDSNKWCKQHDVKRKRMVLSVAAVSTENRFRVKGVDFLLEVAAQMKDTRFLIIGLQGEALRLARAAAGQNVELKGLVPSDELAYHYSSSKVFCQFSLSEGLPNTLCEAMLCECIPVGSNVNGIPNAIGRSGFVLQKRDSAAAVTQLNKALDAEANFGKQARNHIMEHFSVGRRTRSLLKLIKELHTR